METTKPITSQVQNSEINSDEIITKKQRLNVLQTVADFCNSLPFSGKMLTRPAAYNVWKEDNPYYKLIRMVEAIGLLGVMILAHSYQALLGVEKLQKNVEAIQHNPSPETIIACGIDVAYTAANCAATYAQLHLSGRLATHFMRTDLKSVPLLREWGIEGDEVDYQLVAEKLMTALVNDDQDDVDTFFMALPKEVKQKVMAEIRTIMEVVDETYSYEEMEERIAQLDRDVDNKSKFSFLMSMIKNAHKRNHKKPYSIKAQLTMLIVTYGGQFGFLGFG